MFLNVRVLLLFLCVFGSLWHASSVFAMPKALDFYIHDDEDPNLYMTDGESYMEPYPQLIDDPFETFNRLMFSFNMSFDEFVLKPIIVVYNTAMPNLGKHYVSNFTRNLGSATTFISDILQFEFQRATISFSRFFINLILGFGGIVDVASSFNIEYHNEDLGQTLAVYHMPAGPYIVLPILGGYSFRDFIGRVGDFYIDPMRLSYSKKWQRNTSFVRLINKRSERHDLVESLKHNSLDPYESWKSIYFQSRLNLIRE